MAFAPEKKLAEGIYLVRSVEHKNYIGYTTPEFGIGIHNVVVLPGGVRAPQFHFEEQEDGSFVVSIRGLITTSLEGIDKVFAMAMPFEKAPVWEVKEIPQPHVGLQYTIKKRGGTVGWVADSSVPYTQLALKEYGPEPPSEAIFELIPLYVKPQDE